MRLIGGVIGYEDRSRHATERRASVWDKDDCSFFVNARSAFSYLIAQLRPDTIWLPSYVCPDVVRPAAGSRAAVRFFPVSKRLVCERREWCAEIRPGDVVLVIHYFGISWDDETAAECRARGAIVVRDASQALYSALPQFSRHRAADFTLFSPRKQIGVSDGGILLDGKGILPRPELCPPPSEWLEKADQACAGRAAFDRGADDRGWFEKYQSAEAESPLGPYAMSARSRIILEENDYRRQADRRRENYLHLLATLRDFALVPRLDEGDVPLGFPVRVPLRDHVQAQLFEREIFPAVHWNVSGIVPAEFHDAHALSRDLLTLPCDHRYETHDMARLAHAFRTAALSAITLRPLASADVDRLHRWQNDRELYRYLVGEFFGPTIADVENWLREQKLPAAGHVALALCVSRTSEHVGNVYFRNIDHDKGQAELHILIGEPDRRNGGVGTAAMRTALEYARHELRLRRIYLRVLTDNTRAVHVYERVGFKRQEQLERGVVKNGVAKGVLVMSRDLEGVGDEQSGRRTSGVALLENAAVVDDLDEFFRGS